MHAFIVIAAIGLNVHCDWHGQQGLSIVSYESPSIGTETPDSSLPSSSLPPPEKPDPRTPAAVLPTTTVCQCHGVNRGVCLCLPRGLTCHCTATHGHEFAISPNQPAAVSPTLPPAGEGKPIVELVTDPSYCTPCRQLEASIQAFGEDNLPFVIRRRKPRAGETIPRLLWGRWKHVGFEPIQSFVRRWEYANSLTETR